MHRSTQNFKPDSLSSEGQQTQSIVAYTTLSRHHAIPGMEKTRKRKKADVPLASASKGWKKIEVGDELLLGSDEGGFMELEEFTPAAPTSQPAAAGDVSQHTAAETASAAKAKKQKKGSTIDGVKQTAKEAAKADKKGKKNVVKDAGAPADVEDLKAKIAALQQENAALKYALSPIFTPLPERSCSNTWGRSFFHSLMHAWMQLRQTA